MEAEIPRVALLDDGELDDVRATLRALGVAHCDASRVTIGEAVPILFSTPAQARARSPAGTARRRSITCTR